MCHNCIMLEYQQDVIMDKIIKKSLGLCTVRQRFPSDTIWIVTYQQGIKLSEGFQNVPTSSN